MFVMVSPQVEEVQWIVLVVTKDFLPLAEANQGETKGLPLSVGVLQ